MSGTGAQNDPWDLATALSNPGAVIEAGHNINLKQGIYAGDFSEMNKLIGATEDLVTVRPDGSDIVGVDGSIYWRGQNLVVRDMEFSDKDFLERDATQPGVVIPTHDGIRAELTAHSIKFVNLSIHDCRQGFLADYVCPVEINGSIIYYNGWSDSDRGYGHGIYAGNDTEQQSKFIDLVLHSQFGYGLHLFATGTDWNHHILKNLYVDGCTMFRNGSLYNPLVNYGNLIGGSGPGTTVRTSTMTNCSLFEDKLTIGGATTGSTDFTLTNNIIVGDVTMLIYELATMPPIISGNKFYGTVIITDGDTGLQIDHETVFPNNEYNASGVPDIVKLRANQNDTELAKLDIFNGSQLDSVPVDVSSVFSVGDTIKAWNVQDLFVDVQTLVVAGDGTITVDMQAVNRSVATPQGWTPPATVFPDFGCFRLVRQ